jgi:hypothetical protein
VRAFAIAIFFLALLPANAMARPATVDEALYFGQALGMTKLMSPSFSRATDLLDNAAPLDPEWQADLIAEGRIWSAVYEAHQTLVAPPAFADFDADLSNSLESADLAAQSFEVAIRTQETSDVRLAVSHLSDAIDSLELASAALPDVQFPSSDLTEDTDEADSEPTVESPSTSSLDAPCEAGAISEDETFGSTDSAVTLSGNGGSFVCFEMESGSWEFTLSCTNDSTGLGQVGTSKSNFSPLFPGVPVGYDVTNSGEVKVIVTCLHAWTIEATRE